MEVLLKFPDKTTLTCEVPTSWEAITLGHFIQLSKTSDIVEIISILTGVEKAIIARIKNDEAIRALIGFLTLEMPQRKPDYFTLRDKQVKIPKNIQLEMLIQKHLMEKKCEFGVTDKNEIVYKTLPTVDDYPYVLALYLLPLFDPDYKTPTKIDLLDEGITDFLPDILNLKAIEAIPTVDFFFTSYLRQLNRNRTSIPTTLKESLQRGLKDLMN